MKKKKIETISGFNPQHYIILDDPGDIQVLLDSKGIKLSPYKNLPVRLLNLKFDDEDKTVQTIGAFIGRPRPEKEVSILFHDVVDNPKEKPVENKKEVQEAPVKPDNSPLFKQYQEIKKKYPTALLLFRIGDFYETFDDDAVILSDKCQLVQTCSDDKILAGFPFYDLDKHLPTLCKAGLKVAICEQLEDPKLTKKNVRRDVTRFVEPENEESNEHTNS